MVERLLERIIGRLVDINFHVLKSNHSLVPEDYFRSFVMIGEKGEVEEQLAGKMSVAAGLRNILAHEYDEIDYGKIYEAIGLTTQLVPVYLKQVLG